VVPILGILTNCALMYSLGWSNWLRLGVWLVIGQAIYFLYGRRHSKLAGKGEIKRTPAGSTAP
jgi:APA family basic amino acid/polyamine antiporter